MAAAFYKGIMNLKLELKKVEIYWISIALRSSATFSEAAKGLGLNRQTLMHKIKKYKIKHAFKKGKNE